MNVVGVRWLNVIERDEMPDVTWKILLWCLILNTESKDQPGTYWLTLYAPIAVGIELFDSFGFLTIIYSFDFLDFLELSFPVQTLSSSVIAN